MPNNSKSLTIWKEVQPRLGKSWYVIRLDGHGFKAFRVPNIDSLNLKRYYDVVSNVAIEVFVEFPYIQFCYILDDEFYFLFHSEDTFGEDRGYKIISQVLSFVTARFNALMSISEITSQRMINHHKLYYDARFIKLKDNELGSFFVDIIEHGKLFYGNLLFGDGVPYLEKSMSEILKIAEDKEINIIDEYNLLFGVVIDKYGIMLSLETTDLKAYKHLVKKQLKRYKALSIAN